MGRENDMSLAWFFIGIAALGALAFGAVILYRLAVGWDDQAPGEKEPTPGDPE